MKGHNYLLPTVVALIVLVFSVNTSSIWIDEMLTYQVVHKSSFSEMFAGIWNAHGANGGMPLYFMLEWIWTQVFGYGEIGLRSLNIPFAIIYFIVSWQIVNKAQAPSLFCILFFLNPLFIYYMNEARPYVLLLSIGNIFTYLLFFGNLNSYKTLVKLHFSFLLGFLTHMMFVFIMLMYVVWCIHLIQRKKLAIKRQLSALSLFIIPYSGILYYYINIMAGAGEIGGIGTLTPDWKASILQIIYYFAGFGGLGLSRNDLRSMFFSHLSWGQITCLVVLFSGYFILFLYIIKNHLWRNKHLVTVFLSGFIAFGAFCIVNIIFKTRFWERHIIYLLPILLLLLCYLLHLMITSKNARYKISTISIICLTAISGLRTMFDEYYAKEDYKGVATYIKETKNALFLLQGDPLIYQYYGVNLNDSKIRLINNMSRADLDKISLPKDDAIVIVLSSREEFDSGKLYGSLYQAKNSQYNSFQIVPYSMP